MSVGGTMRLGLQPTKWQLNTQWSKLRALYAQTRPSLTSGSQDAGDASSPDTALSRDPEIILERHRHRYEVNPLYVDRLTAQGMRFIGKDVKGVRMEIVELEDHRYFVCTQFHPEFISRVLHPSPPILGFFAASAGDGCLDEVMARSKDQ